MPNTAPDFTKLAFVPHPAIAGDEASFITLNINVTKVIASYRKSLFAHEWLDKDGKIKGMDDLSVNLRNQRRTIESMARDHQPMVQPVLGIGMLDCVEIGAGRDVIMTLAAHGVDVMPVHVPAIMAAEFQKFVAPDRARNSQRGNVFFYLLLAVALLGALSFVVTQVSRSGPTTQLTASQAKIAATEILTYANALKSTVTKLILRGCTDKNLSFYSSKWIDPSEYDTPDAPTDFSCHVFHPSGGGLEWRAPPANAADTWTEYLYSGIFEIGGVGRDQTAVPEDAKELIEFLRVNQQTCLALNNAVGVTNTGGLPPQYQFGALDQALWQKYGLAFRYVNCCAIARPGAGLSPNADELYTKLAGCYQSQDNGAYYFYQVLLAR